MFYWALTRVRPAAGQRFIFFTGHLQALQAWRRSTRRSAMLFASWPNDHL
jgi:hypothetical protein